jgi:hypothetical protein
MKCVYPLFEQLSMIWVADEFKSVISFWKSLLNLK